jgi:hypothetical protein
MAYVANERGIVGRGEQQRQSHPAIHRRRDVSHHLGGHDIGAGARVTHARKGARYTILKGLHWNDAASDASEGRA